MPALAPSRPVTVREQRSQQAASSVIGFALLVVLTLGLFGVSMVYRPELSAGLLILGVLLLVSLARPAIGLGLAVALTVVGDPVAMSWWPFDQNLSARQSVMFVADAATVKPLEIMLLVVVAVILINRGVTPKAERLRLGSLWPPLLVFTGSILFGLVRGLGSGGEFNVAIFEATPLLYIPLVYLAAVNVFTTLRHYHWVLGGILVALTIEGLHTWIGLAAYREYTPAGISPVTHTAATHMNLLVLLFVATLFFGTRWPGKRTLLFLMMIPVAVILIDAERRSGIVALIIGGLVLTLVLYVRNRPTFYKIVPVVLVILAVYTAAFWNSNSQVAFPAQAVKTVIAPEQANQSDASSDLYRQIEAYDLNATIRSNPMLGIGFGKRFYRPIPLPDISQFFIFSRYIPHNTVLWVWAKVGFLGFVSYLYLILLGTAQGLRGAVRLRNPDDASMVAVTVAYLPMALVVAFVEISVDPATTILLAIALALADSIDRIGRAEDAFTVWPKPERRVIPWPRRRRNPTTTPGATTDTAPAPPVGPVAPPAPVAEPV